MIEKITADVELARIGEREDERRFKLRTAKLDQSQAAAERRYREGQANAERRLRQQMAQQKLTSARSRKTEAKKAFRDWVTKNSMPFEYYGEE